MKKLLKRMRVPALVMGAFLILFRFVLFIGYVPTESMEPTIPKGSYIVGTRLFGKLEVGDIIVFRHEGRLLVKRIVAVGGDTIMHKNKEMVVPEECFYVEGDNKEISFDSGVWEWQWVGCRDILAKLPQYSPREKYMPFVPENYRLSQKY